MAVRCHHNGCRGNTGGREESLDARLNVFLSTHWLLQGLAIPNCMSGVTMFTKLASKTILCSALAVVSGMFTGLQSAEAAAVKVRWTPPYGAPFDTGANKLEWSGEATFDDGGCSLTGFIDNSAGSCNGQLALTQAIVYLSNTSAPTTHLQTIDFLAAGGGGVAFVQRTGTTTFENIYTAPFTAVQGTIDETMYMGNQAYFSLVFQGAFAQMYWFDKNPNVLNSAAQSVLYSACSKPGVNSAFDFSCGLSDFDTGKGAALTITPVPEPETYALMLAGLAVTGLMARRRKTRS
jgi:hypothetical protein